MAQRTVLTEPVYKASERSGGFETLAADAHVTRCDTGINANASITVSFHSGAASVAEDAIRGLGDRCNRAQNVFMVDSSAAIQQMTIRLAVPTIPVAVLKVSARILCRAFQDFAITNSCVVLFDGNVAATFIRPPSAAGRGSTVHTLRIGFQMHSVPSTPRRSRPPTSHETHLTTDTREQFPMSEIVFPNEEWTPSDPANVTLRCHVFGFNSPGMELAGIIRRMRLAPFSCEATMLGLETAPTEVPGMVVTIAVRRDEEAAKQRVTVIEFLRFLDTILNEIDAVNGKHVTVWSELVGVVVRSGRVVPAYFTYNRTDRRFEGSTVNPNHAARHGGASNFLTSQLPQRRKLLNAFEAAAAHGEDDATSDGDTSMDLGTDGASDGPRGGVKRGCTGSADHAAELAEAEEERLAGATFHSVPSDFVAPTTAVLGPPAIKRVRMHCAPIA